MPSISTTTEASTPFARPFSTFVNKVPFYGAAVLCFDQPNIQMLIPHIEKRIVTYGLESGADLVARHLQMAGMTSRFEVYHRGTRLGECTLQIPGRHNVLNALAAVGVGLDLEIPFTIIQKALAGFAGVQRRFQVRGTAGGITVVDDYGHHPAEIRATLAAAKAGFDCRIVTVFQPHRYTRTEALRQEFLTRSTRPTCWWSWTSTPRARRRFPASAPAILPRASAPTATATSPTWEAIGLVSPPTCARSAVRGISC